MEKTLAIIITGCASGIGQHIAAVLATLGHNIIATDINDDALRAHAEQAGWDQTHVLTARLDVRDPIAWRECVARAIEHWGHLDLLLNIAGYLHPGYIAASTPEQVALHLDINAKGTILGTQAAAAQMTQQGYGHIINIASLAGIAPVPGLSLYSASKFAVRGFSLAVAQELRPHGVAVTVICPDAVQTPMLDLQRDYPEAALTFSGGRTLTVHDIEHAIIAIAMKRRPVEVVLPPSRGWVAKFASAFPRAASVMSPSLVRRGRRRQKPAPSP